VTSSLRGLEVIFLSASPTLISELSVPSCVPLRLPLRWGTRMPLAPPTHSTGPFRSLAGPLRSAGTRRTILAKLRNTRWCRGACSDVPPSRPSFILSSSTGRERDLFRFPLLFGVSYERKVSAPIFSLSPSRCVCF